MTTRTLATARVRVTDWLLYDQFNVSAAAPLASPRTCDPGPGTLTLVQTDGQFSIVAGVMNFPAQGSAVWGDQGFYGAGQSLAAGRAFMASVLFSSGLSVGMAWKANANADLTTAGGDRWYILFGSSLDVAVKAAANFSTGVWSVGSRYRVALVQRLTGMFYLVKGGSFSEWTLLWVDNQALPATSYPVFANFGAAGTIDNLKVADLDAPFNDDYGIATQRLAGSVAAGTNFTQESNALIEFTVTTLPSANNINVEFRRLNSANNWLVRINPAGDITLIETVTGSPTTRGTSAGVVANGDRVVIVADGSTIRVYEANTLRITYSSATTHLTQTTARVDALGTGGVVSDAISWPRTLSGQPLRALEAVANA